MLSLNILAHVYAELDSLVIGAIMNALRADTMPIRLILIQPEHKLKHSHRYQERDDYHGLKRSRPLIFIFHSNPCFMQYAAPRISTVATQPQNLTISISFLLMLSMVGSITQAQKSPN